MPDLGKYAAEVLAAYGITLSLLALLVAVTLMRGRKARAALKVQEKGRHREG